MNNGRLIKFILLIVIVITAIIATFTIGMSAVNRSDYGEENIYTQTSDIKSVPKKIKIELEYANVLITKNETFSVEANNDNIAVNREGDTLKIKNKKDMDIIDSYTETVTVNMPMDAVLDKFEVSLENGTVYIDSITADLFDYEGDYSDLSVEDLKCLRKLELDSGDGNITITNGSIGYGELDTDGGLIDISAKFSDNLKVECETGKINLNIQKDNYNFKTLVQHGKGSTFINQEEAVPGNTYGDGEKTLNVENENGTVIINYY